MSTLFGLSIKQANGQADEISVTSDDFIAEVPEHSWSEIDPLKGSTTLGETSVFVIDTSGASGSITAHLADANGRLQLLNRKASVSSSLDNGATWTNLRNGFVLSIALAGAGYDIAIGDSRRFEESAMLFQSATPQFSGLPSLIGSMFVNEAVPGPYLAVQTFPAPVFAPWIARIRGMGTPIIDGQSVTAIQFSGRGQIQWPDGRWIAVDGDNSGRFLDNNLVRTIGKFAEPYRKRISSGSVASFYPKIKVFLQPSGSTNPADIKFRQTGAEFMFDQYTDGISPLSKKVTFTILAQSGDAFALNQKYKAWMFIDEITESNPLIISDHPILILSKSAVEAKVEFLSSSLAAMKNQFDGDHWLLRITKPWKYTDFEEMLLSNLGLNKRWLTGSANWELVETRKHDQPAIQTITQNELRSKDTPFWSIDEESIINKVTMTQLNLTPWDQSFGGDIQTTDRMMVTQDTHEVTHSLDESSQYGIRSQDYELPGFMMMRRRSGGFNFTELLNNNDGFVKKRIDAIAEAVAEPIFSIYLRGGIFSELEAIPSISANLGDIVTVSIPWLPSGTTRGNSREMMVLRREETPVGPNIKLVDIGDATILTPVASFSLSNNVPDPQHFYAVSMSNAAALNAENGLVMIMEQKIAGQLTFPLRGSFGMKALFAPNIPTTFIGPEVPPDSTVHVRMRTQMPNGLPTASAYQSHTLGGLSAPTTLSLSGGVGRFEANWVNTEILPVEIFKRLASENIDTRQRIGVAQAGSTTFTAYAEQNVALEIAIRYNAGSEFSSFVSGTITLLPGSIIPPPRDFFTIIEDEPTTPGGWDGGGIDGGYVTNLRLI